MGDGRIRITVSLPGPTGVGVVNVEGNLITPPQGITIPTQNPVNSCALSSLTGQTVCTANNSDVYVISGTAPPPK